MLKSVIKNTNQSLMYWKILKNIEKCNVLIDGGNFYDHPVNDLIKQYDEVRKISIGQGDDYSTEYLLNYAYFKNYCRLIAVHLSKQKLLEEMIIQIKTIHCSWKIKRNILRILKRNSKSFMRIYKWLNTIK